MKCDTCKHAFFKDEGYSNYTVEGTVFYCIKSLHPQDEFDKFYGVDTRFDFALYCDQYKYDDLPNTLDVDHEDTDDLPNDRIEFAYARGILNR